MLDPIFTNGVIAVKERSLLGDKILRFPEMSAEEVLRALHESGFGSGAESYDGEAMCEAEERALDAFIREYAPSAVELGFLLSARDFHNAKALVKAAKLESDAEKLLAPEGLVAVSDIAAAVSKKEYSLLEGELSKAVRETLENGELTGAETGAIFDIALYRHLYSLCKRRKVLKKLLAGKADRLNILTAMRAADREFAEKLFVEGGTLRKNHFDGIFSEDEEVAARALDGTPYKQFYALCIAAKGKGLPYTDAERALESFEAEHFCERKYELDGREPFLYYVFRRRAEIQNVRIILVCLNAGLSAQDIKRRLRTVQ